MCTAPFLLIAQQSKVAIFWQGSSIMKKIFVRGLFNTVPLILSVWLFWTILISLDKLGIFLLGLIGVSEPWFGIGFLLIVVLVLLAGFLFSFNPIVWLYQKVEKQLLRFPLFKTVYSAVRDLASLVNQDGGAQHRQTVLVKHSNGTYTVGFMTASSLPDQLDNSLPDGDWVPVYMPLSYQMAGFTVLVAKENVTPVSMSFEDAMRFVVTAGVGHKAPIDKTTTQASSDNEKL
jgi:uncharacterized membrane protein